MTKITDGNTGSEFVIDDMPLATNTLCYINTDFNSLNTPINILVLCFEQGGRGDLVFGIKFVRYILSAFPTANITILCQDRVNLGGNVVDSYDFLKENFETDYLDFGINYQTGTRENFNITNRLRLINLPNSGIFDVDMEYRIVYSAPAVRPINIQLQGPKSSLTYYYLQHNYYRFSEYNTKVGLQTGKPTRLDGPEVGLMLNTYGEFYPLPTVLGARLNNRRFSICYIYTSEEDADKLSTTTSLFAENWKNTTLDLCHCFQEYLDEVRKLKVDGEKIVILTKLNTPKNLCQFLSDNEATLKANGHNKVLELTKILGPVNSWDPCGKTIKGDSDFDIMDYCGMAMSDMLALYQHSLPTVFISGDQSITDFISVNKYFEHRVFYQIFGWKVELARAMGMDMHYGCGAISADTLQRLKNNPDADFRLKGMKVIESTMVYALQGKPVGGCSIYDQYGGGDPLDVEKYATVIREVQEHKAALLYDINDASGHPNVLHLSLNEEVLDLFRRIQTTAASGDQLTANWFKGANAGNIYAKLIRYSANPPPQNDCTEIYVNVMYNAKGDMLAHASVILVAMAWLINDLIRTWKYAGNLIYTYATIDTTCLPPGLAPGMLILTELSPTSLTLYEFIASPEWTVKNMAVVMFQILWVLWRLGQEIQLVHGGMDDLNNIIIEYLPNETLIEYLDIQGNTIKIRTRFIARLLNFGNSSFNYNGQRYISITSPQYDYYPQFDKTVLFNAIPVLQQFSAEPIEDILSKLNEFIIYTSDHPRVIKYPASDFPIFYQGNYDQIKHVV